MMKNPDLMVHGDRAAHLHIESFTDAVDMTAWELGKYNDKGEMYSPGIYDTLDKINGPNYCENNKIDTLEDVFGKEWADRFFKHKNKLIAKYHIEELKKERENIDAAIEHYQSIIDA